MNTIKVPVTKTVTTRVPNGNFEISLDSGVYRLTYHNKVYKNSPFTGPSFKSEYTIEEIMNSSEVRNFLKRFE